MNKKVLIVAVHPDDETLGCGGTLLKHIEQGDEIHWLIATEMKASNGFQDQEIRRREEDINAVSNAYQFKSVNRLELSAMKVDEYSMSDLVAKISKVFNEVEPHTVYLPFKSDVHSDHRSIFNAAYSCTKSFRYPFVKRVLMIETLSETEFSASTKEDSFIPNVFIDISQYMGKKLEILNIYNSEIGEHPFPRSERNVEALGVFRGATAGCIYAESFMLLKEVK